ncbi:MAG TPA: DUF1295 domain-containing protein, partial [Bacillota bacterium]|nr:DUF1295 domain-containing protein [Bacillota bacterium]
MFIDFQSMTKNQTLWVFLVTYLFAIFIGGLTLIYGVNNNYDIVLTTLASTVFMTIVIFFFSNVTKNASLYDPYWSVIPIVIVVEWIVLYKNLSINVILLLIAVLVWGIRLTLNWWKNW